MIFVQLISYLFYHSSDEVDKLTFTLLKQQVFAVFFGGKLTLQILTFSDTSLDSLHKCV